MFLGLVPIAAVSRHGRTHFHVYIAQFTYKMAAATLILSNDVIVTLSIAYTADADCIVADVVKIRESDEDSKF